MGIKERSKLLKEVNYIDEKRDGIYKSYNDNGKLLSEVNYIDGLKQ
jgi:antitoxin component YwqK of YwqJK toxin-antitoxin module